MDLSCVTLDFRVQLKVKVMFVKFKVLLTSLHRKLSNTSLCHWKPIFGRLASLRTCCCRDLVHLEVTTSRKPFSTSPNVIWRFPMNCSKAYPTMPSSSWSAPCDLSHCECALDLDNFDSVLTSRFLLLLQLLSFSNRPSVTECLNHKWLTADNINTTTILDDNLSPIINVQSINVTITTIPFSSDNSSDSDSFLNFDEDKENSVNALENGEKETSTITAIVQHHIAAANTKLRLEKSSSISLFPDAPTTPKVCRKAPCDENSNSFLIPVPST